MDLFKFEIYNLARELGALAWEMYKELPNDLKYSNGQQLIRSSDSVAANIAEGFGRYYYMDQVRFYYFARGSLSETLHWFDLLRERNIISLKQYSAIENKITGLRVKLNNTITNCKIQSKNKT